MDWKDVANHMKALLIAALAAALIQCVVGFLSYLGAHIPDLIQYIFQTAGGIGAIYKTNYINVC